MTKTVVRFLDWLTMNNILHLPNRIHFALVKASNRLAERIQP
jgi:hypothetical protein